MKASSKYIETNHDDATIQSEFNINVGTDAKLTANFFEISFKEEVKSALKVYTVTISPEVRNEELACKILYNSTCPDEGDRKTSQSWNNLVFNGKDMIISMKSLSATPSVIDGTHYNVTLSEPRECSEQDFKFLYYRVIENALFKQDFVRYESGWIKNQADKVVQNLKIYYQFITHIETIDGKIVFFVDMKPQIMRNVTLNDVLKQSKGDRDWKAILEEVNSSMSFVTNYGHMRKVKINKVLWSSPPPITFNQKEMTIAEFFKFKYNTFVDDTQPFAQIRVVRGKETRFDYIPSGLLIQEGLLEHEKFKKNLIREVQRYTVNQPVDLHKIIKTFVDELSASPVLATFGISLGQQMSLNGKVIPPPIIKFRSSNPSSEYVDVQVNSRCSLKNELYRNAIALPPIFKTSPLIICDRKSEKLAVDFKTQLIKTMAKYGVNILPPEFAFTEGPIESTDIQFIKAIAQAISHSGVPCFIICILRTSNKSIYAAIKTFLSHTIGIPSQFITEETLEGNQGIIDSIASDVSLSLVCKTGGVPFYISPASLPLRNTVFVGFEVSGQNVAAVASYDSTFARYFTDTDNTNEPAKFIGQFIQQLNTERVFAFTSLPASDAKKIVDKMGPVCRSLTVICCSRKDGICLLQGDARPQPASPGTCVIINGSIFITSASAGDDIARPTMYTVVHHFPRVWTDDQLALIIHYLCVAYPVSLESSSLPTPLKFAIKAMKNVKTSLGNKKVHPNLDRYIHYL